jgi:uncharacterized membrane protein YfcA
MNESLVGSHLFVTGLAALFVGLSKGGLPAIGMLSVPILSLLMSPVKAATLLLPIYVLTDLYGIWLYRKDYSARNLKILLPAGIAGVMIGWSSAAWLPDRSIAIMIGFMGIGFCLNTWLRSAPPLTSEPPSVRKGWFWGALAGFTSFVSHAGGPPFQIYVLPQRLPKLVYAGTSTIMFAALNAAKIIPYQQLRPYSTGDLHVALLLVPPALAGAFLGAWLTRRISDRLFFRAVQGALFLVSLKLIYDAAAQGF